MRAFQARVAAACPTGRWDEARTAGPAVRAAREGASVVYALLALAIAAEVAATSLLPRTAGFTALVPSVAVLAGYATSIVLLAHVVKTMPVGVTYAIWASVGTLAVVAIGAAFLGQTLTGWQLVGVVMVVAGVVLLNLGGAVH